MEGSDSEDADGLHAVPQWKGKQCCSATSTSLVPRPNTSQLRVDDITATFSVIYYLWCDPGKVGGRWSPYSVTECNTMWDSKKNMWPPTFPG